MKLYATVTSERASKGQGGNNYLHIALNVEDRENPIGYIELEMHPKKEWTLKWRSQQNEPLLLAQGELKGEKQKDDNYAIHESDIIRNDNGDEVEQ